MRKTINLKDFHRVVVELEYKKIIKEYSKKTKDNLKATSPKSGRPGRSTPYYAGWEVESDSFKNGYRDVVWNRTNWQLTHLLENGHFITNQGALSWSAPRKHIKPAYLNIKDKYIRAMRRAEIKAGLE